MENYPPLAPLLRPTFPARGEVHRVCRTFIFEYSLESLLHLLHIDADGAAAGEADLPGGLVGDAEFERLGLAALDHIERLGDDRALDAAARHRAEEIALAVDDEVRADRPRRRAPGLDHGGKRDAAALFAPFLGGLEDVVVARERLLHHHSPESHPRPDPESVMQNRKLVSLYMDCRVKPGNDEIVCYATLSSHALGSPVGAPRPEAAPTRAAIESRLWIGRSSSTCGSIERMPLALASKPEKRNSGLSQISRRLERCRRSISKARLSPPSRSRPSVMSSTIAPWVSTRRAHSLLNALSELAMRVPPDQSGTLKETAASASSGSLCLSARVTLVSLVPNRKVCTRLRASVTACRKWRKSRVYWLIEPEMSSSATIGGALVRGPRYLRSMTAPPALRLPRKVRRMSTT